MDIKAVIDDDELQAVLKTHVENATQRFVVGRIAIARGNPPGATAQPYNPMATGQEYFSASCVLSETPPMPEPVLVGSPLPPGPPYP